MKAFTAIPSQRTLRENALIAIPLCSVAGAFNAIGFLELGVFTSNVTGNWCRGGAEVALRHPPLIAEFIGLSFAFMAGAMLATFLIEHDLRQSRRLRYVKPLIVELILILAFSILGHNAEAHAVHEAPLYLGFVLAVALGAQNATITKVSGAAVRTTHMTGITTDLGIELMHLLLGVRELLRARRGELHSPPLAKELIALGRGDGLKALLLGTMLTCFTGGAVLGGLAFSWWSYYGTIPFLLLLATLVGIELYYLKVGTPGYYGQQGSQTTRFVRHALTQANPHLAGTQTAAHVGAGPQVTTEAPSTTPNPPISSQS